MKSSIYIGKVSGIKIFIHWTFFILIIWIIGTGIFKGDNAKQILFSVGFILTVFLCVVLHELGHALVAKHFKYRTRDIILLPIGGMARMEDLPENPKQELLVAIAGPVVNVIIASIVYPFVNLNESNMEVVTFEPNSNNFLLLLFIVNITLAIFNLIPAFPMDGGRIFRALLSMRMDRIKATSIAAYTGQVIAVLFFIIGLFYNPFLVLIAAFIFITARAENDQVRSKFLLKDYKVKDLISQHFYKIDQSATLNEAAKLLLNVESTSFLVTDQDDIIGILNRDELVNYIAEKGENSKVREAMVEVKFIKEEASLYEALKIFQKGKTTIMPVMNGPIFLGVLDLDNILELVMIKTATDKYAENKPPSGN